MDGIGVLLLSVLGGIIFFMWLLLPSAKEVEQRERREEIEKLTLEKLRRETK